MNIKKVATVVSTVLFVALVLSVVASAAGPQSGTWKLNAEKSKYSPGPVPKSLTLTIVEDEKGVNVHSEGMDGEGKALLTAFDAKYDGKEYPVTGSPYGDMVSAVRVDANTVKITLSKGGKATMWVTSEVSKDGKTRTSTFTGKDAAGHDVKNVAVYDKQ